MRRQYSKEVRIGQSFFLNLIITVALGLNTTSLLCGAILGWGFLIFSLWIDYIRELSND